MNKKSYITLLSDDSYIYGIILLNESLKEVNSQYPLEVLVTSNVSKPILNILDQLQLHYIIIEPVIYNNILEYNKRINPALARVWSLCLSKLSIFTLTQFDKLVFLDADIMVMKNLDHLFEYPHLTSALDGEYFNLWPNWDHFNSGILVIEPNINEYNNLINFIETQALNEEWKENECIADQEILNHYYKDWPKKEELHLNKYYDIFAPYIQDEQKEDINNNCYFIHFVGRKPWRAYERSSEDTYIEDYYQIAREKIYKIVSSINWNSVRDQIKVTVYAICKNEKDNIVKFIECFTKADYLCILDTGSTDGTWEYLQSASKRYNNLIIDQQIINPWRYDTARNLSLKLAPTDTTIFFMMDLDEIIKESNWVKIIKAKWDPIFSRGRYKYHRLVDSTTDDPILTFFEHRIHSSIWHYQGIVHEQLYNISGNKNFYTDECINIPITVWHYPKHIENKNYIELCEQAIKEEPNNWLMHLQLAIEYEAHNKYEQAINEFQQIIIAQEGLDPIELGRCYASLGQLYRVTNQLDKSLQIFKKGREIIPICGDNYFLAADIYYQQQDFNTAYNLCINGLTQSVQGQWCTIIDKNSYIPYLIMGLSLFYLDDKILALGCLTIAKEKNNNENTDNAYTLVLNDILRR